MFVHTVIMVIEPHMKQGRQHKLISTIFLATSVTKKLDHNNEWLLMRVTEKDSANLLELIHKRRKHSSTIFCSQYLEEDWYQKLGGKDNPLTDAIKDRISFDSYKIPIMSLDPEKDISMREVYGLDPSQAQ